MSSGGFMEAARIGSWALLIGVTGLLVRGEVKRSELPEGVVARLDVVYRASADATCRLDLYRPEGVAPPGGLPTIVAIHGGGWRGGDKGPYGRECAALARRGFVVASVQYRLSTPTSPSWPAALEDVREAVRWLRRHAHEAGVDPRRVAAMGASAGGHLAALLGTSPGDEAARVQAVVDFYGPTDLAALHRDSPGAVAPLEMLFGGPPARYAPQYEAASPLRHASADDPPSLLIHGADDALIPVAQSIGLAEALRRVGVTAEVVVIAGARHGFGLDAGGRDLIPEVLAFLDSAWQVNRVGRR